MVVLQSNHFEVKVWTIYYIHQVYMEVIIYTCHESVSERDVSNIADVNTWSKQNGRYFADMNYFIFLYEN